MKASLICFKLHVLNRTQSPCATCSTCGEASRRGPRTGPARTSSASATPRDEPGRGTAIASGPAPPCVERRLSPGRLTQMLPPVALCLMRWCGRAWPRPWRRGHVRADENRVYRLVRCLSRVSAVGWYPLVCYQADKRRALAGQILLPVMTMG